MRVRGAVRIPLTAAARCAPTRMRDVYVAGVGQTAFGRYHGTVEQMLLDASLEAIESAAVEEFGMIVVGAMNPEAFGGEGHVASKLVDYLGLAPIPAIRVENGPATGATALLRSWRRSSGCNAAACSALTR